MLDELLCIIECKEKMYVYTQHVYIYIEREKYCMYVYIT